MSASLLTAAALLALGVLIGTIALAALAGPHHDPRRVSSRWMRAHRSGRKW